MMETWIEAAGLFVVVVKATSGNKYSAVQFSCSACPTLCDPMDCSTGGFPVHYLLELAQTHVH